MFKIFIIIFLVTSVRGIAQDCSMLEEGRYEMYYDSTKEAVSQFRIIGSTYVSADIGNQKEFNIIKLGLCGFQIENKEPIDESKLTEFQLMLSKQKSYYEITRVKGNVYYFICRVNLHINCGTGKFVRRPY